jgi:hypothetical protein
VGAGGVAEKWREFAWFAGDGMKFGIDTLAALPQISFTNMSVTLAPGLRAICVAVGLLLVTARGAEPVSPLIGATKDQVLARYGEPKSQIAAGSKVVYFYPREKITLRDNVVVEVESFSMEPVRPADSPTTPSSPQQSTSKQSTLETGSTVRPAAPVGPSPAASDSKVEIKLVRPPGANLPTPEPVVPPMTVTPKAAVPAARPPQVNDTPVPVKVETLTRSSSETDAIKRAAAELEAAKAAEAAKAKKEAPPKQVAPKVEPSPLPTDGSENPFGTRVFIIAGVVVAGGFAFLYWRYRQRQFILAATSVVNTPLVPVAPPAFTGNGFTAEELKQLEWKRFEELVAAYYSKTGVVAVRTKTGPESPVHIKISWKGEPRPFAYVQCIAQPTGLIDIKPLQALVAALAADNIRRGYLVTSGKFNAQARDFAEEKHLTLMPAELFLEKLNALPSAARTEIMQSIGSKDSTAA